MYVFVSYGGVNLVMELFVCGVLMLLLLFCNDQFYLVYFVEWVGVGCVFDLQQVGVVDIIDVFECLLCVGLLCEYVVWICDSYVVCDGFV